MGTGPRAKVLRKPCQKVSGNCQVTPGWIECAVAASPQAEENVDREQSALDRRFHNLTSINQTIGGNLRFVLFASALGCSACSHAGDQSILVEPASPVVAHGVLTEAVGIGTVGGVITAILPKGCALPCSRTETFGTADDGQSQITIHLFRGTGALAAGATSLGAFQFSAFPSKPRGTVVLRATFLADASGIHLSGKDGSGSSDVVLSRVAP